MARETKSKRQDAQRNEKRILETTTAMIYENDSIDDLSMANIAGRVGVGVGTLYRHFESKSRLCQAVLDKQVEQMFQKIEKDLEENKEKSLYERVYIILSYLLELKDKNLNLLRFIERNGFKKHSFMGVPFYHQLYRIILKEMEKEGTIEESRLKLDILLNAFSSDIYQYERFEQNYSAETYIKKLLDIFLK
ncbi:TetR/AcrR family transcriptional regulator [Staphylococcus felis]|uniref:TetR/AcrR family transcriptional regulator n=1 Tax=Staphylococcus felis TaxID=46127 RepID=A0A3E0ILQ3_9STAP|nr:TetR/AcrR family transcriptional regulator [Staphylococcus felis]MBH9580523.1 TetR/AcrR family transcriptional regulator [Staphylococcus felis]MDQ7192756.1 TetR/AcrR family transcriptional regulator [Staphylococcus felis]REH82852.1 TetR/AcrR family transcriptional regulator [Staphylococcus felis]REH90889.1 TetR/AcrR family transcriptional regulator [Staphylococcus felis]REH92004.1 TetR/AcrR family transcriptional regulator [Staphylococcus felis]